MPSTNTLLRTINLCSGFCNLRPLIGIGGFPDEPAFSNGDWVRQFILAPPFAWRWNRAFFSFNTIPGQQDYSVPTTDLGWLEKASVTDISVSPFVTKELLIDNNLAVSNTVELPVHISAVLDDDEGTILYRLMPVPDKVYTVNIAYQKRASSFNSINDTWAPIPDYWSYLVNQGFLAKSYEFINDERWGPAMQLFVRQVIAANSGLSDAQVNIFLGERVNTTRQLQNESGTSASARQGRGAF